MPVSQRVQMNFIFNDNVRILCFSCNVKNVAKLVRFKQKGQKQASFLAFHKCCQGCLLRGPRYISTRFILVCTLRCTYITTGYQESLFVGWKVYSSSTNKANIYSYSIYVQQMFWLQDKLYACHLLRRLYNILYFLCLYDEFLVILCNMLKIVVLYCCQITKY